MLIAGEASGDTLGAELAKALRAEKAGEELQFFGAGGPKMAAAGVNLAFDLSAHAVVGIWEVLKNYGKFKSFFDQLLALAAEQKPD
ncbi:MAG TPA: lipid-A-disaccharide synthase, partial [Verrucomicrobiae bacterium]|nr:lipid-A-disaccharide synthase [Verrucomicrobiae bacterium]